jgi:hypothetical protein
VNIFKSYSKIQAVVEKTFLIIIAGGRSIYERGLKRRNIVMIKKKYE